MCETRVVTTAYRYAKPGDYLCSEHGLITPHRGVVPACPECMRWAFRATGTAEDLRWTYDQPTHCPAGHPLVPGKMLLAWYPCLCAGTGGHNTWTCEAAVDGRRCGGLLTWPPCTAADGEHFTPGWRHRGGEPDHNGNVDSAGQQ